ncbi:hypothetical protein NESM_000876000 [Novymonas esmeraldas]|uniref:Uncharacterized protein n=1 Tax=Novymonas esmeraldas TaxID=1808958 RepID=A0AAW0EZW7_9TRYP
MLEIFLFVFGGVGGAALVISIVVCCCLCRHAKEQSDSGDSSNTSPEGESEVRAVAVAGNVITDDRGHTRVQYVTHRPYSLTNPSGIHASEPLHPGRTARPLSGLQSLVTGVEASADTHVGTVVGGGRSSSNSDVCAVQVPMDYGEATYVSKDGDSPAP